jgi:hypothetical protein
MINQETLVVAERDMRSDAGCIRYDCRPAIIEDDRGE